MQIYLNHSKVEELVTFVL